MGENKPPKVSEQQAREAQAKEAPKEPRKLYRSRRNRVIAGVAGGLGEYLGIDPVVIRILWVLFTLLAGSGILAYIAAWIIMPERPSDTAEPTIPERTPGQIGLLIGVALVVLGIWFFLTNLGLVPTQFFFVYNLFRQVFWPMLLILIGILIIVVANRREAVTPYSQGKPLHRSRSNRMLAGVAGGLAEYFGVDISLVRLAFVVLLFTPLSPAVIIAYIIFAVVIPEEPK
ncbi:MAG: PspC domain-containing protein [Firmicutes bacterium]|nr:PspC domain-containing protein [Bacillota bacterium]